MFLSLFIRAALLQQRSTGRTVIKAKLAPRWLRGGRGDRGFETTSVQSASRQSFSLKRENKKKKREEKSASKEVVPVGQ